MFYVGNELWLEESWNDGVDSIENFSGCICLWYDLSKQRCWFKDGAIQSPQDPVTGEWLPAVTFSNGLKMWYNEGKLNCFYHSDTGEWLPAIIHASGAKFWYDHNGLEIENPNKN